MNSLKQQGTKAFIWDFLGKLSTHGMSFVISIFLARLLDPSDFGLIAMVMVIVGIAQVFSNVGLASALIQRSRTLPIHYNSVFYFNIFIASILAIIIYLSAPYLGAFYDNSELISLFQVMSLSFIIAAFNNVQNAKLRKELNYALLTKIRLISSLLSGILGISLAFWGAGVWSLVTQILTMDIVYSILIWTAGHWKPSLEFSWKALMQLWSFGFRLFLSAMLNAIFTRLDFLIIGKLFPLATLGFFQRANSLNSMVIQYSSGSLMSVLFPVLSKVQNDLPRFQNIILKSLGIINFVIFLLLGGLYLISEELIVLLFSDKWLPSVAFFKILVLSGFGYPIGALLINALKSRGNSKAVLQLRIYTILITSANLVILYFLGIDMYLYGLIVQTILALSLNILFVSREIALPFYTFSKPILVQMTLSVFSVVLTILITKNIESFDIIILFIKGSIFTFLYVTFNYILKTSSFGSFAEQVMPMIKKKFGRKMKS